ncbi:MAG TPA: ParB N-terminal domain-containing protein [Nitrososphaerales archaeon]|nr:ParB N-terminal domain-containing protein [Nitrososphaerales archaeon]
MSLAKAGFTLGIKPVSTLRPHEETIPAHVQGLAAEMQRDGVQKDPIIIDLESLTVLDGMHRLAAFISLGVENAVCCSVDYASPTVKLGRWARVYTLPNGYPLPQVLSKYGLTRRSTLAQAFDALEGRDSGLALLTPNSAYLPEGLLDLGRAMETMSDFDGMAEVNGWKREFVPEDDVDVPLQSERSVVLLLRKLRKDDVVNSAKSGRLFPCKTSMHVIDPRPVAVNFPMAELDDATSASLRRRLEGKHEQLLPPGSLYEGRRYKERLLLLNQG